MRIATVALFVGLLTAGTFAAPLSFDFQPTPADLGDLDHSKAVTWGLNWKPADGLSITGACLTIKNIRDWTIEDDSLYIHLLDNTQVGVKSNSDTGAGDWFAGNGRLLTTFIDTRTQNSQPGVNFVYTFTPADLVELNKYTADGKFGFGFDPDCHYYNDGVKLSLTVGQVPEPATLAMLAAPLPMLLRRRR